MGRVEIEAPLSPSECEARLRAWTGSDRLRNWFGLFDTMPLLGRVAGGKVRWQIAYRGGGRDRLVLVGRLSPTTCGTRFRGRVSRRLYQRIFLGIGWLGLLLNGLVGLLLIVDEPAYALVFEAFCLFMFTAWLSSLRFRRRDRARDERWLIDRLTEAMGGEMGRDSRPFGGRADAVSVARGSVCS